MPSKQKQQISLSRFLLFLTVPLMLMASANAEPDDQRTFAKILQHIISSPRQVSYVGKQISIAWTPEGCQAQEELVLHQPPSTHFVKVLTPPVENRWPRRMEGLRRRGGPERRRRPAEVENRIRRRFEGRFFSGPPRQQPIELMSQEDIEQLTQNYTFQYTTSEEIAGHQTDLLTIEPRFEGRPTKRLWLAKEKGIILRLEDFGTDGNLRFLSVYTQISFQPGHVQQKLAEFQNETELPTDKPKPIGVVSLAEAREAFNDRLILPENLPQGFQLQSVSLIKLRPKPTVHLRYTDGLMMFSLFQEPKGKRPRERLNRGMRIQHIHGTPVQIMDRRHIRIVRWFQGDVGLTLIGELSQSEIIQIAESLIPGPAQ
jgi:negative regulator of sigma E activity